MNHQTLNMHALNLLSCITIALLIGGQLGIIIGLTFGGGIGAIIYFYTNYPRDIATTMLQALYGMVKQMLTPRTIIMVSVANLLSVLAALAIYKLIQNIWMAEIYATFTGYAVLAYTSSKIEKIL